MALPPLDVPTLFVITALVIAFSGCVLIVARGRDEGAVPLALWGAAMLAGAAGIVLLSLDPFTTLPVRVVGHVAILIGVALSWTGARIFAGRHSRQVLIFGGAAAWLAGDLVDGAASRLLGFLLGAIYIFATAAELWRGREERLPTRTAAILLLVIHGAIYLWQAIGAVIYGSALSHGMFLFLMLEALLHTTGMAFLFLALMKERAELRSTLQLRRWATQDGLTGLGNRRTFDQLLHDEFRRAARSGNPIGLLMIDVDQFKSFNDTYGHQAGDECLKSVASAMRAAANRAGDFAMRYGGEEFAVLLSKTDEVGALAVADDIRSRVERLHIQHVGSAHGVVTASIGVVSWNPRRHERAKDFVMAADRALYEAKSTGRNLVRLAHSASLADGDALAPNLRSASP